MTRVPLAATRLTRTVGEGRHAARTLQLQGKRGGDVQRRAQRHQEGARARTYLQHDKGYAAGRNAAGILLDGGAGVGVEQRAQLGDDDGLTHADEQGNGTGWGELQVK